MSVQQSNSGLALRTTFAWLAAIVIFFPMFWLFLTAFKTEQQAIAIPPLLVFEPTMENFSIVQERSDYFKHAMNSIVISLSSTLLALLIAIPGAYAMAFYGNKRTPDILMWMLSTKMLPAVGVFMPIYLMVQKAGLLDTRFALIVIFTMMNLPIVIWMMYSYFKDIPGEILEASRMDGTSIFGEIRHVLIPLSMGGIASTALLVVVLCWNEAFWSIVLTTHKAAPLSAMMIGYSGSEDAFWAKLSAASAMAIAPVVVFGWFCQKQLVHGLTFGAVK